MPCPRPRSSDGSKACNGAAHRDGTQIKLRSAEAIVFKRGRDDGFDKLYSCLFADGKLRRIAPEFQLGTYKLGGHFLAYVYAGSAIGDESDKIGVLNLRTHRNRLIKHLDPTSEGPLIEGHALHALRRLGHL